MCTALSSLARDHLTNADSTPSTTVYTQHLHLLLLPSTKVDIHFYHPTDGRRLRRPKHCSKGVQSTAKAVYVVVMISTTVPW